MGKESAEYQTHVMWGKIEEEKVQENTYHKYLKNRRMTRIARKSADRW